MTDRKWRVIDAPNKQSFYNKVEKYERLGYTLLPASFNLASNGRIGCLMMKN